MLENDIAPVAFSTNESGFIYNANQPNNVCDFSTTHTKTNATADKFNENMGGIDCSLAIVTTAAVVSLAANNSKKVALPTVADEGNRVYMKTFELITRGKIVQLSSLPDNDQNKAKENTIYMDPDTKNYLIREKGIVYKGCCKTSKDYIGRKRKYPSH